MNTIDGIDRSIYSITIRPVQFENERFQNFLMKKVIVCYIFKAGIVCQYRDRFLFLKSNAEVIEPSFSRFFKRMSTGLVMNHVYEFINP